jgi:glutamate dehydrogenase (NAD(P)+)
MREAFNAVWQIAEDKKVSLRTAAFIVGCTRVLHAHEMRGLYP